MRTKYNIEHETVILKLNRSYVYRLKELAIKESIRQQKPINPVDIVKEALRKMYPDLFSE